MRRFTVVLTILVVLAPPSIALGDEAGGTETVVLHCDPGSRIDGIDGDERYVIASYGPTYKDCEIQLPPGKHVVKACYALTGPGPVPEILTCDKNRGLEFNASPGSVYRLRLQITPARVWNTWMEDVTATEAHVPASPVINKARKDLPKDQRKSTILVRASERDEPAFLKGEVQHLWFRMKDLRQAMSGPSKMHREKDGYFTDKVSNGDSLAIYYMFHQDGSAFSRTFEYVCDTELPVYEDLPGGKVLYLGDYRFEKAADGGRRFTVTHDVEAARNFLRANHPDLVDKLVVADYRVLRTSEICGIRSGRLRMATATQ
jgi:hypothetical protein